MNSAKLPSSVSLSRPAVAPRSCARHVPLNPACIARSAAAKKPERRPGSNREEAPPTKRRRTSADAKKPGSNCVEAPPTKRCRTEEDAKAQWDREAALLVEKDGVNDMLLRLLPPGSDSRKVISLPDPVLRVLQENQTGRGGGEDDELEIDVDALGDDALRAIKNRVGAYLEDRARRPTVLSPSKKQVTSKSAPRSIPPKVAPSLPAPTKPSGSGACPPPPPAGNRAAQGKGTAGGGADGQNRGVQ